MHPVRFDPIEVAKRHPITFEGPAVNFFEGGLLGNGGLGAVVTTRPDAIVVRFGHNNVWDVRVAEKNKEKIGTFQDVFDRVRRVPESYSSLEEDPWYHEYRNMTQENYRKPYPRPFPCGSLVLGFDRRTTELLGHSIDIATGACTIDLVAHGLPVRVELFTEMARDRLWIRLVDREGRAAGGVFNRIDLIPDPDTPKEFPPCKRLLEGPAGTLSFEQVLPYEEPDRYDPSTGHPRDRAFRLSVRISGPLTFRKRLVRHHVYEETPDPSNCPEFLACVQLDEGIASELQNGSGGELPSVDSNAYARAQEESRAAWREFWGRSGVLLEDAFLERVWYWNLYFFNCAVRPGVTCPGLFANWSYRKIGTAWHGDYHLDYNAQQPFWVSFSSNHVEKHLAYVDMIDHLRPVSRKWAREYFGLRGACYPVSAYPAEMSMCPYPVPTWGWMISVTPWAVQSLWWHYLYTLDRAFLRERAFEPLKEAVLFLVDYMQRPEARGPQWNDDRYHVFPTVPPELYALTPGFRYNYDCLVDLVLIRFLFKAYVEACRILDVEQQERELLAAIRSILDHFPEYPTAQTPGGAVFVSVPGEDPEIVYNLANSTFTVFPGEEHGLHSSPEDYELAVNSYRRQRNEGGNELVLLNLVGARLGRLDLERFKRQIRYCMLPNGTCTDKVLEVDGRYDDNTAFDYMAQMGIWFENFALPVVINECLLQSYTGTLRFFPNWPKDRRAAFRTLRAVGGFLVSALFDEGRVQWIQVESETGAPLRLINPWPGEVLCQRSDGTTSVHAGDAIEIETSPGDTLLLSCARPAASREG